MAEGRSGIEVVPGGGEPVRRTVWGSAGVLLVVRFGDKLP